MKLFARIVSFSAFALFAGFATLTMAATESSGVANDLSAKLATGATKYTIRETHKISEECAHRGCIDNSGDHELQLAEWDDEPPVF